MALHLPDEMRMTRREIAAVNACAGIPTEALEADVVQRMREALKYLVDESDPEMDNDYNPHAAPLKTARAILKELDQ